MRFTLYGVEIHHPFRELDIRKAVAAEVKLRKKFLRFGWSETRTLEEIQIIAKPFYNDITATLGYATVNEFIYLFNEQHKEFLLKSTNKEKRHLTLKDTKGLVIAYLLAASSLLGSVTYLVHIYFGG